MIIRELCEAIESVAPLYWQEKYDNSGLLLGSYLTEVHAVLITLDVTEAVIDEAKQKGCNVIVSHHPLIFGGIKRLVGQNDVQRCVAKAIKSDIAIYAAHTNMDNAVELGVNAKIASLLKLTNTRVLQPAEFQLLKLVTFVPKLHTHAVKKALFDAGCGNIGNYDSCSFTVEGSGTFRPNEFAQPFVGTPQQLHTEPEYRMEVILPAHLKSKAVSALLKAHPYEVPAYDLIQLENSVESIGAGIIGEFIEPVDELLFLQQLKTIFKTPGIKHTQLLHKKIKKVALCGGSGSSLLSEAIKNDADIFISADFKYHQFFEAENKILIADIGHYESEQFTKDIFFEIITKKLPTFAVRISEINTNPINYL